MLGTRPVDGLTKTTSGFDFLIGEWTVRNRRLRRPLTGTDDWYTCPANARSTTLHNGAISIDEMWFPEQGFAGSAIRLYQADRDLWSIYWVNSDTGRLQPPVSGRWSGSTFEAYGDDEYDGKPIMARFFWHSITPTSAVWEQAYSDDTGQSWETNWVMTWTRLPSQPGD
jgi:hypothetical protein